MLRKSPQVADRIDDWRVPTVPKVPKALVQRRRSGRNQVEGWLVATWSALYADERRTQI